MSPDGRDRMRFPFKLRRSAGVRVTPAVHRRIAAGNRARAARDWSRAAQEYASAIESHPDLAHVWVQLGHARKEGGDLAGAKQAYTTALGLRPQDADIHLQLGHAAKLDGDLTAAGRYYLAAARLVPDRHDAIAELLAVADHDGTIDHQTLTSILAMDDANAEILTPAIAARRAHAAVDDLIATLRDHRADAPAETAQLASFSDLLTEMSSRERRDAHDADRLLVVFDVSDLVAYFRHGRSPSGIQRVQMEIIASAFHAGNEEVRICCFQDLRDEWVELPAALFLDLCRLSLHSTDETEWSRIYAKAIMTLRLGNAMAFRDGAFLVNLGTSWWIANYFLLIRDVKRRFKIRYVPFVHDMIPIVRGDLCPPLLVRDFIGWAINLFDHADFYLANSRATCDDLLGIAAYLGRPVDPARVAVVPLDADFRAKEATSVDGRLVHRYGLDRTPYILIVSTLEPRKNHIRAFEAWTMLMRRHGARRVPKLVCVGQRGWMNERIYDHLNAQPELAEKVLILSGIADADLAQLYEHCLFTFYPSHYEGWGMPITESLCHGKVPLASRVASIPEAGGPFADYVDPESSSGMAASLERLIFDPSYRHAREALIASDFCPRRWSAISRQITASLSEWHDDVEPSDRGEPPLVVSGGFHPFGRNLATRIWPGMQSGERYRAGINWWGPDDWGCWSKSGASAIAFRIPASEAASFRIYLRVLGLPTLRSSYRLDVNGLTVASGNLRADEGKWLGFDVHPDPVSARPIQVELISDSIEDIKQTIKTEDQRIISIGVAGFYVASDSDPADRARFLEAVAIGNVDDLAITREPLEFEPMR